MVLITGNNDLLFSFDFCLICCQKCCQNISNRVFLKKVLSKMIIRSRVPNHLLKGLRKLLTVSGIIRPNTIWKNIELLP